MKISAKEAKAKILVGDIKGTHEVLEYLDLSGCTIAQFPRWQYQSVNLTKSKVPSIGGMFRGLNASESTVVALDTDIRIDNDTEDFCANFAMCANLTHACGRFQGYTFWYKSAIRTLDPNALWGIDKNGDCANFAHCKLTSIQGVFPGFTDWSCNDITSVDQNTLFGTNKDGDSVNFNHCKLPLRLHVKKPEGRILESKAVFLGRPLNITSMEF